MKEQLDPAKTIVAAFGGPKKVAEITERALAVPSKWMYPKERGGTGGFIPNSEAVKLLAYAKENGIDVEGNDFFDATRLRARLDAEAAAEAKEKESA